MRQFEENACCAPAVGNNAGLGLWGPPPVNWAHSLQSARLTEPFGQCHSFYGARRKHCRPVLNNTVSLRGVTRGQGTCDSSAIVCDRDLGCWQPCRRRRCLPPLPPPALAHGFSSFLLAAPHPTPLHRRAGQVLQDLQLRLLVHGLLHRRAQGVLGVLHARAGAARRRGAVCWQ